MKKEPINVMGCMKRLLMDAVPIVNFILSVLHIIIGIGNTLINWFFEWIKWRVEKLTQEEVVHRVHVKEAYDRWLEDEGVLLAEKKSEKKRLSKDCHAKVLFLLKT
jgi:hypothetical protein